MKRSIFISLAALGMATAVLYVGSQSSAAPQSVSSSAAALGKYVDQDGTIHLPEDYRLKWVHLGSWYVEGQSGGAGEVNDVFTQPETGGGIRKKGKRPGGRA